MIVRQAVSPYPSGRPTGGVRELVQGRFSKLLGAPLMAVAALLAAPGVAAEGQAETGAETSPASSDEVQAYIVDLVARTVGVRPDALDPSTDLISIPGSDALAIVEIIMELEDELGIAVPDEKANDIHTIGDLFALVTEPVSSALLASADKPVELNENGRVAPTDAYWREWNRGAFAMAAGTLRTEVNACLATQDDADRCTDLLLLRGAAELESFKNFGSLTGSDANAFGVDEAADVLEKVKRITDSTGNYADLAAAHGYVGQIKTITGKLTAGAFHLGAQVTYGILAAKDQFPGIDETALIARDPALRISLLLLAENLALQGRYRPAALLFEAAEIGVQADSAGTRRIEQMSLLARTASAIPADYLIAPSRAAAARKAREYFAEAQKFANQVGADAPRTDRVTAREIIARYALYSISLPDADAPLSPAQEIALLDRAIEPNDTANYFARDLHRTLTALGLIEKARALGASQPDEAMRLAALAQSEAKVLPHTDPSHIAANAGYGELLFDSDPFQANIFLKLAFDGAVRHASQDTDIESRVGFFAKFRPIIHSMLHAFKLQADRQEIDPDSATDDLSVWAFETLQWAGFTETAAAFAKAAQYGNTSAEVARKEAMRRIEQQRALAAEAAVYRRRVVEGQPVSASAIVGDMTLHAARMSSLLGDIMVADLEYVSRTAPEPISIQQVQSLLHDDEAMVVVTGGPLSSVTVAVSKDRVHWSFGPPAKAITDKVDRLRAQLAADLDRGTRGLERDDAPTGSGGFDPALAFSIYRDTLQGVEGVIGGKGRVMIVSNDIFDSLPASVLVTSEPVARTAPRYLVDDFAVSSLPSVSSLAVLRCKDDPLAAGCESHGASQSQPLGSERGITLAAIGAPQFKTTDALPASAQALRGAANMERGAIEALPDLPGARVEISQAAALFPANETLVRTGAAAREALVKTEPSLATARFVLLATHGLLPVESSVGESGLVFTPPVETSPDEDGFLSASEVELLDLSADFVILSACNTATSDKPGGGLSELGTAFLRSGAKSLLASHWPVADQAGAELVVATLRNATANPSEGRATAFQKAILEVKADKRWGSPAFWGPYALIGTTD